jgi:hypothetical protein
MKSMMLVPDERVGKRLLLRSMRRAEADAHIAV